MTRQAFDEFIEEEATRTRGGQINGDKKRDEWLEYLGQFYETIDQFLESYVTAQKLFCSRDKKLLNEERIGEYEADTLAIKINSTTIRLDPIGTNLIGGKGRVDMVGPKGKVKFVLVPKGASRPKIIARIENHDDASKEKPLLPITEWEWRIMTPPPQISYMKLEEDSFYAAMLEVLNG